MCVRLVNLESYSEENFCDVQFRVKRLVYDIYIHVLDIPDV